MVNSNGQYRYYISFVNPKMKSETYTIGVWAKAPRKAVRNARRKLAKDGITSLHYTDCYRFSNGGTRKDGTVKARIHRFALAWKW